MQALNAMSCCSACGTRSLYRQICPAGAGACRKTKHKKNSLEKEAVFQCLLFKFKGVALKWLIRNFDGISRAAFKCIHHIVY